MKKNERIFGLDCLRAIAILMVVSSHLLWIFPKKNNLISFFFELFGFWGVELFFVLSGFLIGSILFQLYVYQNFTLQSVFLFLKRRWFRTLPNYYLVLIINLFIAFLIGYEVESIGSYFVFLQNFSAIAPAFFPESWSLSVEEYTYLLLPIALFIGNFIIARNKSKIFLSIVLLLLSVFFFAKVIFNISHPVSDLNYWNLNLKSVVVYRIDAILIGVLACWFCINYNSFWIKFKMYLAFIGVIVLLFLLFGISSLNLRIEQNPFFWNVFYLPLTSIGFAFFFPFFSEWKLSNSFFKIPVEFVSKVSYSIYLLHYSIILQLMKHFVNTEILSTSAKYFFTFCYLVVTFLLSYVFYRFYEKPMMDLRDKN